MNEIAYLNSSFGLFEIKGSEFGIQSVKRCDKSTLQQTHSSSVLLGSCVQQLSEYFAGKRKNFDLQLDWGNASEFYKAVWRELLKIPYGHTSTYSIIAEKIGSPKSVRAVGLANKNNPIAIIVPCHRVIAKSGDLQGYYYGLEMKRALLELENPKEFAKQGTLF